LTPHVAVKVPHFHLPDCHQMMETIAGSRSASK
jgi:hypothetical protein